MQPMPLSGVERLLAHPDLLAGNRDSVRILGVMEIFRARRVPNGKFMNVSRAMPCVSGSPEQSSTKH
jgi:hypothetical protein